MTVDTGEGHLGLQLVGRYQLTEVLARGALCPVYRADDVQLRRPVAVKAVAPDMQEFYRASLRATTALAHPATVAVYDAIEHGDWLFLVQEYVPAHPLSGYLKQGVPAARAVDLGVQLARALDYIHRREMVHGDLTPGAVLVDRHAVARINNFGLPPDAEYFVRIRATLLPDEATSPWPANGAGEKRGADEAPTAAGDVRAVGYLLWQLLSEASGAGGRVFRPDVSEPVARLVRQCCAVSEEEPFASAAPLVLALEELAERLEKERPPMMSVTPPSLRAARAAVEEAAAWSLEETVASNQVWSASRPGRVASASAATDPPTPDVAVTRPALDQAGIVRPGLRLPARPYADVAQSYTLPDRELPWQARSAPNGTPAAPQTDPPAARDGLSLSVVLLLGGLLFVIFFAIGYLLDFTLLGR